LGALVEELLSYFKKLKIFRVELTVLVMRQITKKRPRPLGIIEVRSGASSGQVNLLGRSKNGYIILCPCDEARPTLGIRDFPRGTHIPSVAYSVSRRRAPAQDASRQRPLPQTFAIPPRIGDNFE
jgi:hypothetical protein